MNWSSFTSRTSAPTSPSFPPLKLVLAILATIVSYCALLGNDYHGLRYVEAKVPFRRIAQIGFISYAFSMNLGSSLLSGGTLRMRLYSAAGLTAGQIVRVIFFGSLMGMAGQMLFSGTLFSLHPVEIPARFHIPFATTRPLGFLFLTLLIIGVSATVWRKKPLRLHSWQVPLPATGLAVRGILVSACDWGASTLVLVALLPSSPEVSVLTLMGIILLAQVIGVLSAVPGGLGVVELVVIALLPDSIPQAEALGALIAYRVIYYLLPFLTAVTLLAVREWQTKSAVLTTKTARLLPIWQAIAPNTVAVAVILSGILLLVSGSTPALPGRMQWLEEVLPLGIIEGSHFASSVAGILLLILGWSLQRRVHTAWYLSVGLVSLGIVLSLLKGFDFEEALVLFFVLMLLLPSKSRFTREARLVAIPYTRAWWLMILFTLGGLFWLLMIAYSHVAYRDSLWFHFSYQSDISRSLRAGIGVLVTLTIIALLQLFSPSLRRQDCEPETADDTIKAILAESHKPDASLALLGDKRFLLNEAKDAFLMYGVYGRSMIVMGDPVGPTTSWDDLLWDFREECYRRGARAVFYQISESNAHRYIDMGLHLYKIGEEGRVPLRNFTLEGKQSADQRQSLSRARRDGCSLQILTPQETIANLPRLREISDDWLSEKGAKEKRFSLGRFDENYLSHFSTAVVYKEGLIVAFANLFISSASKEEFSIDLMRYEEATAPKGCMTYLFTELILWGQTEGFEHFTLGIAPLSGLEERSLAPIWHRLATAIFNHGEHFYNFQGLRAYKEKFHPVWTGVYLATTSPWDLPASLLDTSAVISGDLKGVFSK